MPKIIQKKTKVLSNVHLKDNYYKLSFSLPEITPIAQPGQFVMLRISRGHQPLLRRPFSIHRVGYKVRRSPCNSIEILYEVIGKGTQILSKKKPGEYLDVLGPLGNGFDYRKPKTENRKPIMVAGGMGVAPLFFLAQRLKDHNTQYAIHNTLVLIGAKTKKDILSQKEFASLGCSVKISTDDGSAGFKGKVTDLLKHLLSTIDYRQSTIYACGPKPMLREISMISEQYSIPAQISLDEYMACGLGVCLGCMVKTREGQRFVCHDGPVFDSAKIKW